MLTNKPFSITFKLDAKLLAIIYICYKYKFPLSFMLSFYEMYGEQSLFILKALACTKKITLHDNTFIKIIEESKLLHKQILNGIDSLKQAQNVPGGEAMLSDLQLKPQLNLSVFSDDYKLFIQSYLLENVVDLFTPILELKLNTADLYTQLV